ncbi:MAG TPA: zf-HC2 domain-containing protein [Ktedonobacterales bacterium]
MNAHDAWLLRLSNYHSGGVTDAQRAAVENHLTTCHECQEALEMYRRFYTLLRSPLSLGAPSARFDETTVPLAPPRPSAPRRLSGGPRRPRRWLAGAAATLAAAVIIAGFVAVIGPRLRGPTAKPTATAVATASAQTTATAPSATLTPAPNGFVCANQAGSSMVYAYVRNDYNVYMVSGCSAPRLVASTPAIPLAWSPSNRYLAVSDSTEANNGSVSIFDTQTGIARATGFTSGFWNSSGTGSVVKVFLGWLDDSSFLGGLVTIAVNPTQNLEGPGATTLIRVNVASGAQARLGSIKDWANVNNVGPGASPRVVANGRYYYYAGGDGPGATTASLHRIDLTTGVDTRLVWLGLYTSGGCQVVEVCMWTAPWDVSSDGAHILYHHPGADSAPSDTGAPTDTPIYYANPDGSGATPLFGGQLASTLVGADFAPNGSLAAANWSSSGPSIGSYQMKIAEVGGAVKTVDKLFMYWRGDSAALIVRDPSGNSAPAPIALYDLHTGALTPLEANSNWYVWGH